MVAVDQRLSYRGELYAGDVISIRSAIIELGTSSIRFVHEMQRDETGEHVATSILKGVHIDTVARRSCPLPEELRVSARKIVVADPSAWESWPPPRAFTVTHMSVARCREKKSGESQQRSNCCSAEFPLFSSPGTAVQDTVDQYSSIFFRIAASGSGPRPAA